jgi:hypothetical protein
MIVLKPLRRCVALSAAALLALAGCSNGKDGGESATEDQAALTELSNRLVDGKGHAYTAEYLVEGSDESVLVAVDPEAGTAAVVVGDRPELWTDTESTELTAWLSQELEGVLPAEEDVASCVTTVGVIASVTAKVGSTAYTAKLVNYHDGVDSAWLGEITGQTTSSRNQ